MSTSIRFAVYMPHDDFATTHSVSVQRDASVEDLSQAIRNHPQLMHFVENDLIMLFKYGLPMGSPKECYISARKWLCTQAETAQTATAQMQDLSDLSEYFLGGPASRNDKKIDVIIVTRKMFMDLRRSPPLKFDPLDHSPGLIKHSEAVTFKLCCKGDSAVLNPDWTSVVVQNDYKRRDRLAEFIKDVVRKPRRAEDEDRESAQDLLRCYRSKLDGIQNPIVDELLTEDSNAPYTLGNHEMIHFNYALNYTKHLLARERNVGNTSTGNQARYIVLDWFGNYWLREVDVADCTFDAQLPFPLIVDSLNSNMEHLSFRKYQPRPDVAFLKHGFPRFLAEVDSLTNQSDEYCLQVQMACAIRLACALQKPSGISNGQFFLMGAFFSSHREVDRFFFYMEGKEVCYHKETFDMDGSGNLTTFLFEFYNYARHVAINETLGNKAKEIAKFDEDIRGHNLPSLYSSSAKSKKRPQQGKGHDDTDDRAGRGSSKHARQTAMKNALRRSRYEVKDTSFGELEPFVELPVHIVEGRHPDGTRVIAKLTSKNSEELSLLDKQKSLKSQHNHTIPLIDIVQSDLGPIMILPWATSLAHPIEFEYVLKGKVVKLGHELVEGVAFLHRQKIAHLDIKPGNLVYNYQLNRLYIIDFDLAMQCKDVDEMVEFSCGTPGWSAPEIVYDNGRPLRAFSPIRADLWSCGKLLRSFQTVGGEVDADLSMLMQKLMDIDPRHRPLLHKVVDEEPDFWTSGRLRQVLKSKINGQVQTTKQGSVRFERVRDDAGGNGLACKLVRKANDSSALLCRLSSTQPTLVSSLSSPARCDQTHMNGKMEDSRPIDV